MTPTSERLLVVDDEPSNRDLLCRRLQRHGFSVEAAESGYGALERLRQGPVDLVLLDSMMPGMSGIEVLKELRTTHGPDVLPVIMVTAMTDSRSVAEALDLGANDYVTKPIDFAVALARIRAQLSRKQTECALRRSEERYALAARGANDGLWDWDLAHGEIYLSERWKSMLGYQTAEITDKPDEWFSRVHLDDLERLQRAIAGQWDRPGEPFECEYRIRHKNGSYVWVLGRGLGTISGDRVPERMAGSQSDITNMKTVDPLTGLPNRLLFEDRLRGAIERLPSDSGRVYAVLFLDLDRFKIVNDSLGHMAGDSLLAQVADRLRGVVRDGTSAGLPGGDHVIARMGGDEFAVLLDRLPTAQAAMSVADRILAAMRKPYTIEGRSIFCSASIGVAMSQPGYRTPQEPIRDADTAMYAAKSKGKGCWVLFDGAMRDRVTNRLRIESDLQMAIERGQLFLQYQPRVEIDTGRICGCEALLRWQHPEQGIIPPDAFIPIAEETGQIREIGIWVLRQACRQLQEWHAAYPEQPRFSVAVNVSVVQCREADFVERVGRVLQETGVDPACVHLEITESIFVDNLKEAQGVLMALKDLGVGLKLDDFGTGYSCLRYLSKLPFDMLKIDRSFTLALDGAYRRFR